MKQTLMALFFVLFMFSFGDAQPSSQLLFDEANTLLENNEYYKAMNKYRQIEASKEVSGALFLNMGITATQFDSMGLAKFYFLKSSKFETTKASALEALDYIESQFSRQSATLPKLPWDKAVNWLKSTPTPKGIFLLGFLFICVAVLFVLCSWFRVFSFKRLGQTVASFTVLGTLVVALSFYVDYVDHRYSQAVVITTEIQVMQQPTETAHLVSIAYEGYSVTIDHSTGKEPEGWYYIRLGNGQFGWVKHHGIKII